MCLRRGVARIGWRRRQLRYPIGWVARMKEDERLIYAVVGTRRGGGGGGGGGVKYGERASGVALACGFGACCLACGFRACRFGLWSHYDTGRVRCCQGGIFGNMSADTQGGIPAYAGMTCERVSSCRVGRTFLRS